MLYLCGTESKRACLNCVMSSCMFCLRWVLESRACPAVVIILGGFVDAMHEIVLLCNQYLI